MLVGALRSGRRYLKFFLYMVICFNALSCAVYMTACPPVLLSSERLILLPSEIGQHCINDSWLFGLINDNPTLTDLYSTSAYFAIVTFMTVGFGDYSATTFHEV